MPTLPTDEARRRFATGAVARMATLRADGTAALVPVVFEVMGDRIVSLVDPKPKRTPELARLRHIERDPRVTLLVDLYEENWSRVWWARAEGTARVVGDGAERDEAMVRLRAKYQQYESLDDPFGDAVIVDVTRWSGWSASSETDPAR
jgi:PPOX class probable F420-dependent enzyme